MSESFYMITQKHFSVNVSSEWVRGSPRLWR